MNYGYIPHVLGGGGEELYGYLPGAEETAEDYVARIIGIIHRHNNAEDYPPL